MKTRVYKGPNIHELFKKIRRDFGPEAIILQTRTRDRKGVLKLFGKTTYEVIVGSGEFKTVHDYKPKPKEEAVRRAYDIEQGHFALKSEKLSPPEISKKDVEYIKDAIGKI